MRTTTLAYVLAPVLTVVTTILPDPVSAAEAPRAQAVTIADLDLASASGQRELDTRIRRAARSVCGVDTTPTGTHVPEAGSMTCFREALRSLRARVAQAIAEQRRGG